MPIVFVPSPGQILICDYDMAHVSPEMRKVRRAVVVSPRSYNVRHGSGPGRCLMVPFSASPPKVLTPSDVPFAAGLHRSLSVPTWAICGGVAPLSHARLDRVAVGRSFLSERLTAADFDRVKEGLRHVFKLQSIFERSGCRFA